MSVEWIETPFRRRLFGLAAAHDPAKSYGQELIGLLDTIWRTVREGGYATTGINHALYAQNGDLFAGVEPADDTVVLPGLLLREISIGRYAFYRHTGPYRGIGAAHERVIAEIRARGLAQAWPVIEVYGHWTEDEAKLVTDLIYPLA